MSDAQSPPKEEETASAGDRPARDNERAQGRLLDERVQIATLQAHVRRLEEQREALRERVGDLESEVESLEEERAMLETTLEQERKQRQQVIETYERILDEREEHPRDGDRETGRETASRYPLDVLRRLRAIPSRHL